MSHSIRIETITVSCKKKKLITPYVLSFGTIDQLDSVQTEVKFSNGVTQLTEAVPLPGYSDETKGSIENYLNTQIKNIEGKEINVARAIISSTIILHPFACSPLLTAIDLLQFDLPNSNLPNTEYVIPASVSDPNKIISLVNSKNFKTTVKIKLSGEVIEDIKAMTKIINKTPRNISYRLDANKAYKFNDAFKFYNALQNLNHPSIEYVEQPLEINDWNGHAQLVKEFPSVQTMLDESIITLNDLEKAKAIGIKYVKFKLFKQGGIKELIDLIRVAANYGMKIVIGNGVATEISNKIENSIYQLFHRDILAPSEANGFLKIAN